MTAFKALQARAIMRSHHGQAGYATVTLVVLTDEFHEFAGAALRFLSSMIKTAKAKVTKMPTIQKPRL